MFTHNPSTLEAVAGCQQDPVLERRKGGKRKGGKRRGEEREEGEEEGKKRRWRNTPSASCHGAGKSLMRLHPSLRIN